MTSALASLALLALGALIGIAADRALTAYRVRKPKLRGDWSFPDDRAMRVIEVEFETTARSSGAV